MKSSLLLFLLQIWIFGVFSQNTYRAAVVEYATKRGEGTPENKILENVQEYIQYIEFAANKNCSIIVFPEDGLTGFVENVDDFSTEIPNPDQFISPCSNGKSVYSKALVNLSCSAKTHKIYVVVNLIEKEYVNNTNSTNYYNVNVAFDREGNLVAKYRKMHLYNEDMFTPGSYLSTFTTDFGVTFGMFICFDIMFKNPAVELLTDKSVTDVVYSVAWFSQLPFLEALSVQHGYAKANGVNLLVSGLDIPVSGTGGSGIFLANGKIPEMYVAGFRSSKVIIQDVPIIAERKPSLCQDFDQSNSSVRSTIEDHPLNISAFKTSTEYMNNYTFKSLHFRKKIITESVCSGKFCCLFEIVVNTSTTVLQNYAYKLVAFHGSRSVVKIKTIGIQNCGVVACLNNTNESCGRRHALAPQGIVFERISIKGNFNEIKSYNQPATLKFDMKPLVEYKFCKQVEKGRLIVNMTTTGSVNSLLTFGIYGRVYSNDDKPAGVINSTNFINANVYVVFLISVVVLLLQD